MADLFGGTLEDPFPAYNELREIGDGVHWCEQLQAYLVCRYDDVRLLGSDHRRFSSDVFYDSAPSWHDHTNPAHLQFVDTASRLFMFSDPPTHTRIRSSFRHVFTPSSIAQWEDTIRDVTRELIGRYPRGREFDIMPGFAADVPVAIIASILGVPDEARAKFREWSYGFASTFDPVVQGEMRNTAIAASLELFDYLRGLIDERSKSPKDDLISELIQTETISGDRLEDVELVAQLALLLVAGNETTTTLIGSGLTYLLEHPVVLEEVRADRDMLPVAIEEILRLDPPLHLTLRKALDDTDFGSTKVPAGAMMAPCLAAANRDPRRFDRADSFDIHRSSNKHLAFYNGIHFCVGAPLGRMEVRVVLGYILDNFPNLQLGSTPARRRTTNAVARGWATRPVVL
ncbi:cytochrome P450 [[Mycobacterium] wendilense]|uniref:Cytochrome P450 n=1 Tax=[Mycobacterium] wendilense TaxID=3064284 RepID=A0ABM9MKM9_9MYCO|nr:cytochrome P450 [Mycolicibacterium sp. MU0050]CAJ1587474.1 cytochrome P450 [Mycolicibacterium sp. MU0050]